MNERMPIHFWRGEKRIATLEVLDTPEDGGVTHYLDLGTTWVDPRAKRIPLKASLATTKSAEEQALAWLAKQGARLTHVGPFGGSVPVKSGAA